MIAPYKKALDRGVIKKCDGDTLFITTSSS